MEQILKIKNDWEYFQALKKINEWSKLPCDEFIMKGQELEKLNEEAEKYKIVVWGIH